MSSMLYLFIPPSKTWQTLATTSLFTISILLIYPCSWNFQYVAFSDRHHSVSNKPLRFLHILSWLYNSYIFCTNSQLSELSIAYYPFACRRTAWLHLQLANYERGCYNHPCADLCVNIHFQLLWVNTKECACGISVCQDYVLFMKETTKVYSKEIVPFCSPKSNKWEFLLCNIRVL